MRVEMGATLELNGLERLVEKTKRGVKYELLRILKLQKKKKIEKVHLKKKYKNPERVQQNL